MGWAGLDRSPGNLNGRGGASTHPHPPAFRSSPQPTRATGGALGAVLVSPEDVPALAGRGAVELLCVVRAVLKKIRRRVLVASAGPRVR